MTSLFAGVGTAVPETPPTAVLAGLQHRGFEHASPSQIDTYRLCARKWWLEKVGGVKTPTSPAMLRGIQVHRELELYTTTGTPGGPIAQALYPYLPAAGTVPAAHAEHRFGLTGAAVPIVGSIDLVEPQRGRLTDYKVRSDIKYAKTAEQLTTDVQAVVYGSYAAGPHPGPSTPLRVGPQVYPVHPYGAPVASVVFRHLTVTDARKVLEVQATLTPADLAVGWSGVVSAVSAMAATAQITDPGAVPPTDTACGAYGGCPHRAVCAHIAGGPIMNPFLKAFGGNLKNALNADAPPPPPPPPLDVAGTKAEALGGINPPDGTPASELVTAPPPPPAPKGKDVLPAGFGTWSGEPWSSIDKLRTERLHRELLARFPVEQHAQYIPAKSTRMDLQAACRAMVAALSAPVPTGVAAAAMVLTGSGDVPTVAAPPPDPDTMSATAIRDAEVINLGITAGLTPRDVVQYCQEHYQRRPGELTDEQVAGLTAAWACRGAPDTLGKRALQADTLRKAAPPGVDVDVYCRRTYDRYPGELTPEQVATCMAAWAAPAPAAPTAAVEVGKNPHDPQEYVQRVASKMTPAGFTLCIDCIPNGAYTDLAALIAPFAREVERELSVPFYLVAPYSAGPRGVAGYLRAALGTLTGTVVVDSAHPSAGPCLEILLPAAGAVYRGVSR